MVRILEDNRPNTVVIQAKDRADALKFVRSSPDLNVTGMTSIPKMFHKNFYGVKTGKVYIVDRSKMGLLKRAKRKVGRRKR